MLASSDGVVVPSVNGVGAEPVSVVSKLPRPPVTPERTEVMAPDGLGRDKVGVVMGSIPPTPVSEDSEVFVLVADVSGVSGTGRIPAVSLSLGADGSVVGKDNGTVGKIVKPPSLLSPLWPGRTGP